MKRKKGVKGNCAHHRGNKVCGVVKTGGEVRLRERAQ